MANAYAQLLTTTQLTARSWVKEFFIVLLTANLIAVTGFLSIPLPFTPVPLTIQCHAVLFAAALLGRRRAAFAVLTFLFEGGLGLPVFANGKLGLVALMGPTGGYLMGYLIAAYFTGLIAEKLKDKSFAGLFSAMAIGNGIVFLCGVPWLAQYVGFSKALALGLVPFILGDAMKLVVASKALKFLTKKA